jgi:hypothetical protein
MGDIGPTILELAGGAPTAAVDGISFAKQLHSASPPAWPRDAVLIEYQSLQGGPHHIACTAEDTPNSAHGSCIDWIDAYGYHEGVPLQSMSAHPNDSPNNTFSAIRFTRGDLGELLYAEFADVSDPQAWRFAPDHLNFFELYNMSVDPFMLENIYHTAPVALVKDLHTRLQNAIACKGAADCSASLSSSAATSAP